MMEYAGRNHITTMVKAGVDRVATVQYCPGTLQLCQGKMLEVDWQASLFMLAMLTTWIGRGLGEDGWEVAQCTCTVFQCLQIFTRGYIEINLHAGIHRD